ncbi:MAG: hypothetical protein V3U27_00665, partial [Candidatus Tectomicrobia bacterium]
AAWLEPLQAGMHHTDKGASSAPCSAPQAAWQAGRLGHDGEVTTTWDPSGSRQRAIRSSRP